MTGVEEKARRLLELAREGDEPSAAQLAGLHGAIMAGIAAEGAIVASSAVASKAAVAKAAGGAGAFIKGLLAASAVAVGTAGFFAVSGDPAPAVTPLPSVTHDKPHAAPKAALPAPAPAPSIAIAEPAAEPKAAVELPTQANRGQKPAPSLRLQDEAALLAEVQGALRSGNASGALSKLESYDRRFPGGMLRAEADAARVFALCGAGRTDKARAAATRFVQRYPSSPAAARVQAACK